MSSTAISNLKYKEVSRFIKERINCREYSSGDKIPSNKELSKLIGVNYHTVRRGVQDLVQQNVLEVRPRSGTFVVEDFSSVDTSEITSLAMLFRSFVLREKGYHPVVGSCISGAHHICFGAEAAIQTMFFRKRRLIEDVANQLHHQKVKGVIICNSGVQEDELDFLINKEGISVVIIEGEAHRDIYESFPQLTVLERPWRVHLRDAVSHFRSLGHNRIGFLYGESFTIDFEMAYREIALENHLEAPDDFIYPVRASNSGQMFVSDIEKVFTSKKMPTAMIISDDALADMFLQICYSRNVKVPQDVSIAVINDATPNGHAIPLTSVDISQESRELAGIACGILLNKLGRPVAEPTGLISPARLVIRASSGVPRSNL